MTHVTCPLTSFSSIPLDILISIWGASLLVFPNSFRAFKGPVMLVLAIIACRRLRLRREVLILISAGTAVTLAYMLVGILDQRAYEDSLWQTAVVYVLSPIFWLVFGTYLFRRYSLRRIINFIVVCGILGCITVPLFFFIFSHFGSQYLTLIIDQPNTSLSSDGIAAATLHVFGSMIFIFPAFLSVAPIYRKLDGFVILLFTAIAVVSGRAMLVLSTTFGLLVYILRQISRMRPSATATLFAQIALFLGASYYVLQVQLNVNLASTFQFVAHKLVTSGGAERQIQYDQLVRGAFDSFFLGVGHGTGVEIIRDPDHPWRYEMLMIATLFRVGAIGMFIYGYPAIASTWRYIRLACKREVQREDTFFIVGLIATLIGICTNPYLESFEFQWMIFLPYLYFTYRGVPSANSLFTFTHPAGGELMVARA